jgi:hypothetical protein
MVIPLQSIVSGYSKKLCFRSMSDLLIMITNIPINIRTIFSHKLYMCFIKILTLNHSFNCSNIELLAFLKSVRLELEKIILVSSAKVSGLVLLFLVSHLYIRGTAKIHESNPVAHLVLLFPIQKRYYDEIVICSILGLSAICCN